MKCESGWQGNTPRQEISKREISKETPTPSHIGSHFSDHRGGRRNPLQLRNFTEFDKPSCLMATPMEPPLSCGRRSVNAGSQSVLIGSMLLFLASCGGASAFEDLPPAAPSEYNSLGKLKLYVGHINDLNGLKAALEACSYRKEVIVISSTDTFVDAAAQTISMLW